MPSSAEGCGVKVKLNMQPLLELRCFKLSGNHSRNNSVKLTDGMMKPVRPTYGCCDKRDHSVRHTLLSGLSASPTCVMCFCLEELSAAEMLRIKCFILGQIK